jgi:hypothetical protein
VAKGIHLRYKGDDVRAVRGVGAFQNGTVAFAPMEIALELLKDPAFEAVADGPSAQAFIVRIGQDAPVDEAPSPGIAAGDPAAFELELEEEERRLAAEADGAPPVSTPKP